MDYFLGVDIGTTSAKAIAFNEQGELICKHSCGYAMQHPHPNYSELDPVEIMEAVTSCMQKVIDSLKPSNPRLISFSAMMHSLIAVDEKGEALTQCILWADNRAAVLAKELRGSEDGERFYHATGVPVHAMSPFCKLLWMKEHEPTIFKRAYKFIGIKEFIFFKLFHLFAVDTAIASATGLLNLYSLDWDKDIISLLDIPVDKLSEIVPVEQVFHYIEKPGTPFSLNLPDKIPFVIGGSDGALANLGTGSAGTDSMSVTIGTSAAVRVLSDLPVTEMHMSIFCYHASEGQYIIGGASNNGAIVMQWIKESLLQTSETFDQLFRLAENVSLVNDDLFFVPYILGERAPVWNSDAKGIFCGLSINHTKAHIIRAAMEGITYNLYTIGNLITKSAPVEKIYAAGGFAESSLWLQLLADIFNCRVLVCGSVENSALGAVMVGIKALKLPFEIRPAIIAEHGPDPRRHASYQKQYQKFDRLYKLFKNEFSSSADLAKPVAV